MSRAGSTWSATIPPERFAYFAEGGLLVTDAGSGPRSGEVTCTAQQAVFGQFALHIRSSPAEEAALEALMRDGGIWSGIALP